MLTVRDILQLHAHRNFELVSGRAGLDGPVLSAGILDYEYVKNAATVPRDAFTTGSVAVSSLLFAKDDETLLLHSIMDLIKNGVSALIYKAVLYDDLPQSVTELSERHGFPVIRFSGAVFFEDIIFETMEAIRAEGRSLSVEKKLGRLLNEDLTRAEIALIARQLNPRFSQNAMAVYRKSRSTPLPSDHESKLDLLMQNPKLKNRIAVGKYDEGVMFILSADYREPTRFLNFYEDVMRIYSFSAEDMQCGFGCVHDSGESLNIVLREAYHAYVIANLEGRPACSYKDIGVYRYLLGLQDSESLTQYMYDCLGPLLEQEGEGAGDLLKTATAYVLEQGDLDAVAKKLFCHKNTVRYRINKIQDKLECSRNEFLFYEQLAAAVRIYLLKNRP